MTTLLLLRHATRPFDALTPLAGERAEAAGVELLRRESRCAGVAASLASDLHAAAGPRIEGESNRASRTRLAIVALGRAVHNRRPWRDADLAAASGPLPPHVVSGLDAYRQAFAEVSRAEAAWSEAFAADLKAGRRAIAVAAAVTPAPLGIALAGRTMGAKIAALAGREPSAWGHGDRHVAAKALAYLARMGTKTSPQSVFCATALAHAGGNRAVVEGFPFIERVDLILSVAESRKVACTLAGDPAVAAAIIPRPNPTLREEGGALLFWRFASLRNAGDDESLSRVKDHPVLRAVLEGCTKRPTLPGLRAEVAKRCGLDETVLAPFLRQMIESGVLIAEIEIPYNERRPLRFVATRARAAGCDVPWIAPSLAVEDAVDVLPGLAETEQRRAISRIGAALESLPHVRSIKQDELFRLDAASGLHVTVPEGVLDELRRGLRPYTRLFAALYPARRYLQGWIDRFLAKFPADRDVELMDVYRAITEQAGTYRPAAFPDPYAGESIEEQRAARTMTAVRDYLATAARSTAPGQAIVFDDATLDGLAAELSEPRWACGVLFQIAAPDPDAIARGEYRLVLNGLFHGAGLSLSRFAHLLDGDRGDDDAQVVRELRRAWSVVERPGTIVAELTYNHLGRTANAGLRPAIFEHELELPGDCASPGAHVLGLRDCVVRFDTASDRFVLRRATDGVEVIPVINSGVNPVGFVSFLVAIGEQALQPVGYFPGFDVVGLTYWPPVVSGKLTLFRERWVFRAGEWPAPPARGGDLPDFARAVLSWQDRWRLPRHVFVHSSHEPKPRYVDLGSPVFVDLLRRDLLAISAEASATLYVTAMCPGPGELFVRDQAGGYATEFLVQMSNAG